MPPETATTTSETPISEEALIASLGEPDEGEARSEATPIDTGDAPSGDDQPEPEVSEDDEPPEFWSAEKKALWAKVQDPEIRAAIRDHVKEVSTATSKKLEEGALKARQAEESAQQATAKEAQYASWWEQNGQSFAKAFADKWSQIDWRQLAKDDPARCQELRLEAEAEAATLAEANRKGQEAIKATQDRAQQAEQRARTAEHEKLATKYPKEFGTREAAEKTYGELSTFLAEKGVPADRIAAVYEAPVVEIVRMAYAFQQLQAKAKGITNPKQVLQSASMTPRRITPGPARTGNQGNDAERQAVERLKKGDSSEEVLRVAFR